MTFRDYSHMRLFSAIWASSGFFEGQGSAAAATGKVLSAIQHTPLPLKMTKEKIETRQTHTFQLVSAVKSGKPKHYLSWL